jgi:DNA helicase HerA-like ATPase
MNIDEFSLLPLKVDDFLVQSVAVLGIKGSGKSNTAAVLAEELLVANVPLCIVDVAGEYAGLKEKFEIFSVGCSLQPNTLDAKLSPERAAAAAKRSYERGVSVILDVSGYSRQVREIFLLEYMTTIWNLAQTLRHPYVLFLEEAHNYIPQSGQTPLTAVLTDYACEGRKRGLGIISIGQRSARIDKNVLAQADILFLHRVRHPADMSVYYDLIPRERKKVQDMVARCKVGEAIVLFGEEVQRHRVRLRYTPHWGYTPSLADLPSQRGVASVEELVQAELPLFQLKS